MDERSGAIDVARLAVIEKLAAFRNDPTDDRLIELDEAIEGWHRAVREGFS